MKRKIRIRIKSFLDRHQNIDYLQKCIRNINNKQLKEYILNREEDGAITIRFETLGNLNKDKNIFLYDNTNMFSGFFAVLRGVLHMLFFTDRFNLIPVIEYCHDFPYAEEDEINGTMNPWEYYFEPTSDISVSEAYSSFNVVRFDVKYGRLADSVNNEKDGYIVKDIYVDTLGEIYKKYIRLNTYVKPIILNDINNLFKEKKTLGVHVRGTDFKVGFNNHPRVITPEEYADYALQAISDNKFDQIFLATDDIEALNVFKDKFGDTLIYFEETARSSGDVSVVMMKSKRYKNKYLLGLEALRDVYALAACDGLIAGLSNISMVAQIINASSENKYEYHKIINKGINSSNIDAGKFNKKKFKA